MPSVLWRCWLRDRKGIRPVKTSASKPLGMAVNVNVHYMHHILIMLCSLTFGANLFNSAIQLGIVDSGAHIRNGPPMPLATRWQMRAIHCIVLPRPISSAKIAFTPFTYSIYTHTQYTHTHTHTVLTAIFQVNPGQPVAPLIVSLQSSPSSASSQDRPKLFIPIGYFRVYPAHLH